MTKLGKAERYWGSQPWRRGGQLSTAMDACDYAMLDVLVKLEWYDPVMTELPWWEWLEEGPNQEIGRCLDD